MCLGETPVLIICGCLPSRFCQMHKQPKGFTVNPLTLKNQQIMEHPQLGEFSVLILAAAVAHEMEVLVPPKLWAPVIINQPSLAVSVPESFIVKEEFSTPIFQRSASAKKIAGQIHSDIKLVEGGSFSTKSATRRTPGWPLSILIVYRVMIFNLGLKLHTCEHRYRSFVERCM